MKDCHIGDAVNNLNFKLMFFVIALSLFFSLFAQCNQAEAFSFEPKVDYNVTGGEIVSADDLDGDGDIDIIAGTSVLLNNGDGTFAPKIDYGEGLVMEPFGTGDFDGDGDVDLVDRNLSVFDNDGNGVFAFRQDFSQLGLANSFSTGDIDLDGDIDVVSTIDGMGGTVFIVVYKNDGSGNFAAGVSYIGEPESAFFTGVAISDLNFDSFPDIVAVNSWAFTANYVAQVFLNNGDGTFAPVASYSAGTNPQDVALGDFDSDGDIDISAPFTSGAAVAVLLNNGDGTFAPRNDYSIGPPISSPLSLAINDFDSDGDIDIASANRAIDTVSILPNNGDGTFGLYQSFGAGVSPYSIVSEDFNADGKPDLAVMNKTDKTVSVLLNNLDNTSPTLNIEAEDELGNLIPDGSNVSSVFTHHVTIKAVAFDASGISDLKIKYTINDWATTYTSSTPAASLSTDICGMLVCPLPVGTVVKYKVQATDNNLNTGYGTEQSFIVGEGVWLRVYGDFSSDEFESVQQTSDGGYIAAGTGPSYSGGGSIIIKFDFDGQIEWTKHIDGSGGDSFFSIQQTSDDGYVAVGKTEKFGAGGEDFLIAKFDSSGNEEWIKTLGHPDGIVGMEDDIAYSVQQTSDGGYIIAGKVQAPLIINDFFIIKLDSFGNLGAPGTWAKTYGGNGDDIAYSVQQTSDGGYIVLGGSFGFGSGSSDGILIKIDSNGNQQWAKTYGGVSNEGLVSLQITSDGGYILTGWTGSYGAGDANMITIKLDSFGDQQWAKTYGGAQADFANSIRQTSDGGYVMSGHTASFGGGNYDFLTIKLDSSGNQQWAKTYGGTGNDFAKSIKQTLEGGYIITGGVNSFGIAQSDFVVMKTDQNGNVIDPCDSITDVVVDVSNVTPITLNIAPTTTDINPILSDIDPAVTSPAVLETDVCDVNSPPRVVGCSMSYTNFCTAGSSPQETIGWGFYDDNPEDTQLAYQIQIARDNTFSPILYDSGKVFSFSTNYSHITTPPGIIQYGEAIYWRVNLWDNHGLKSNPDWDGNKCGLLTFESALHQYPDADFTYSPLAPLISENISFDPDSSVAYGGSSMVDWEWDFDYDSGPDSNLQYPTTSYPTVGSRTVDLKVTDSDGYSCSTYQQLNTKDVVVSVPAETWAKAFGEANNDATRDVTPTNDGGFAVVGISSPDGVSQEILVVKLDHEGNQEWAKGISPSNRGEDMAWRIEQTSDDGYIIASTTYGATIRPLLIKLDSLGNEQWKKEISGSTQIKNVHDVRQTSDEGYVLAGYDESGHYFALKLDSSLVIEWAKSIDGYRAHSIEQTDDNGYILAGIYDSAAIPYAFLLIKLNPDGSQDWIKKVAEDNLPLNWATYAEQTSDGGYIASMITNTLGAGGNDVLVIKFDSSGNQEWRKTYGGTGSESAFTGTPGIKAFSIQETFDDGYILAGGTDSFGGGALIIKIDSLGNAQWARTFSDTGFDSASMAKQTLDGGYVISGTTSSFGAGLNDLLVLRLDSSGNIEECSPPLSNLDIDPTCLDTNRLCVTNLGALSSSDQFPAFNELEAQLSVIDSTIVVSDASPAEADACLSNNPPTLTTEAWIPDSAGTEVIDGGVVNLEDINEAGESITIYSVASDSIPGVIIDHKIRWWKNSVEQAGGNWDDDGGVHNFVISGPLNDGDVIEYRSEATDDGLNTSYDPADGTTKYSFRVVKPLEITINHPIDGASYAPGDVVTISGTAKSNLYTFPPFSDEYTSFTEWINPRITDGTNTEFFVGAATFTKTGDYTGDINGSFIFPAGFSGPVTLIVYIQGVRSDLTVDSATDTVNLIAREACEIDSIPDLTVSGTIDDGALGSSVSLIGDFNGDGFDDIVVNEHGTDKAYIYFGGMTADNIADKEILGTAAVDINLSGMGINTRAVSSGDFNNDGYDDVVVGDYNNRRAFIYYGGSPMDNVVDITLNSAVGGFGYSVASGDVNNDGYDDIVLGTMARRVDVYYGGSPMDEDIDLILYGDISEFGYTIASSAGDVNGDGFDDIIVGSDSIDRAYIFYGGSPMDNVIDITFTDATSVDQDRVSSAGDVNGDGFDDILLGSPWEIVPYERWVYLYYGSASMNSNYTNLDADLSFNDPNWSANFIEISSGDMNGDKYSDVIISSIYGKAYIYYGGLSMDNIADVTIDSFSAPHWGWSLSAGDFNGNGLDDIIVGSQLADAGGTDRGEAYVYQCLPPNDLPTLTTEVWIPDDGGTEIIDGEIVNLENIDEVGEYLTIYSNASDASGIQDHKITYWRYDSAGNPIGNSTTTWFTGGLHSITINGPLNDGDVIEYQVEATDTIPNPTAYNPADGLTKYSFTVRGVETWIRSFTDGNLGNDGSEAYDVLQVNDGYIIASSHKISIFDPITWTKIGQRRLSITKLNHKGFVVWSHDYGDAVNNGFTLARSIKQTSDLGYIVAGSYGSGFNIDSNIAVLKVDSIGNKEWYKTFTGINHDHATEVIQTSDLGYIIAGHTSSYDADEDVHDALLIKLDSAGNKIWEKTTNTAQGAYIFDLQKTSDDNYIGVGVSDGTANIFKLDSSFNLLWSKKTSGATMDSIAEISGGNYIAVGAYKGDFLIIKVDINGNKIWQKIYDNSGSDYLKSVSQTSDGGFVVFGQTYGPSGSDAILIKFDSNGNKEWAKKFGGHDDEYAFSVKQTVDGGYIAVGWETSVALVHGMYIIKTDSSGNVDYCFFGTDINLVAIAGGPVYWNDAGFVFSAPSGLNVSSPAIETGDLSLKDNLFCNDSPSATTNAVLPIDYCVSNLPAGIELMWSFVDTEDDLAGIPQTGYELKIVKDGDVLNPCDIIKNPDDSNSITGLEINALCSNFIDYGGHTYTWEVKVYDSVGADSGFVAEPSSFPAFPTPDHRYPTANFSYSPPLPILQFQEITFDPLTSPDNSEAYGGASIASFEWDFDDDGVVDKTTYPADPNTTHFYSETGTFTVDLRVTDSDGYACWASRNIPANDEDITIDENKPLWNETNP